MSAGQGRKAKPKVGPKASEVWVMTEREAATAEMFADLKRAFDVMEEIDRLRHVASCRECQRKRRR